MNQSAIKVEGLYKEYVVGHARARHETFYEVLASAIRAPFKRMRTLAGKVEEAERFLALRDVSFDVAQGEVVGIIGRNGAGKSTLLKILSRITSPTRGRIEVRGRLASLLEVGTGFHPELSGRENIYLNGAILGMSRREVVRKFDEIVAFAEIDKFVDTPVKRYSSGMYVRLAFAVAAHLEPDILVVDEVLAVGDAEFQSKCLGKMEDVRSDGRTVLIVSHNIPMISKLCRTAIWIDKGEVASRGDFDAVSSDYLAARQTGTAEWTPEVQNDEIFHYKRVSIVAPDGSTPTALSAAQNFWVQFEYAVNSDQLSGRLSFLIRNQQDIVVLTSSNTDGMPYMNRRWRRGRHIERCEIPGNLLAPGVYFLTISKPIREGNIILESICSFEISVVDALGKRDGRQGVIAPLLKWEMENGN